MIPNTTRAGLDNRGRAELIVIARHSELYIGAFNKKQTKILRGSSKVCLLKGEAILYREASVHVCVCVCSRQEQEVCASLCA